MLSNLDRLCTALIAESVKYCLQKGTEKSGVEDRVILKKKSKFGLNVYVQVPNKFSATSNPVICIDNGDGGLNHLYPESLGECLEMILELIPIPIPFSELTFEQRALLAALRQGQIFFDPQKNGYSFGENTFSIEVAKSAVEGGHVIATGRNLLGGQGAYNRITLRYAENVQDTTC
ncbi:hypothetical protein [Enterovibrio norvegicus]|uniref:hypothetical protein n=1 Tax=Enterovibrio norvegicus TaxID=188144 RepID=UPI00352F108C